MLIVDNTCASGINAGIVVDFNILDTGFHLRYQRIVGSIQIGKQIIQIRVNEQRHQPRISVVTEHAAVLPHSIGLRLFAGSRVVYRMQCRESHPSAQRVAAANDIKTFFVILARYRRVAVHHIHSYCRVLQQSSHFTKHRIERSLRVLCRRACIICTF